MLTQPWPPLAQQVTFFRLLWRPELMSARAVRGTR